MSTKLLRLIASLIMAVVAPPLAAQVLPEGPVLAAADLREGQTLDGEWT